MHGSKTRLRRRYWKQHVRIRRQWNYSKPRQCVVSSGLRRSPKMSKNLPFVCVSSFLVSCLRVSCIVQPTIPLPDFFRQYAGCFFAIWAITCAVIVIGIDSYFFDSTGYRSRQLGLPYAILFVNGLFGFLCYFDRENFCCRRWCREQEAVEISV